MNNIKKNLINLVKTANSIDSIIRRLIEIELTEGKESEQYNLTFDLMMELFNIENKYLDKIDLDYIFNPDMTIKNNILKYVANEYATSDLFTNYDDSNEDKFNIEKNLIYLRIEDALLYRGYSRIMKKWKNNSIDDELISYLRKFDSTSMVKKLHSIMSIEQFNEIQSDINMHNNSIYCNSQQFDIILEALREYIKNKLTYICYFSDSKYLTFRELDKFINKLCVDGDNGNSNNNAIIKNLVNVKYQLLLANYSIADLLVNNRTHLKKDELYSLFCSKSEVDLLYIKPKVNDIETIANDLINFIIANNNQSILNNCGASMASIIYRECDLMAEVYVLNNKEYIESYVEKLEDLIDSLLNDKYQNYSIIADSFKYCLQEVKRSLEAGKTK